MKAVRLWHCYLGGADFAVVTDHNPNTYFDSKMVLSPRQVRWMELLSRYSYKWKYIKGRLNVVDPLSRKPEETPHKQALKAPPLVAALTRREQHVVEDGIGEGLVSSRPKQKNAGRNVWREVLPGEED